MGGLDHDHTLHPASVLGGWTVPRTVRLPHGPTPTKKTTLPARGLRVPPCSMSAAQWKWGDPSPSHSDLIQERHTARAVLHMDLGDRGREQTISTRQMRKLRLGRGTAGRALARGRAGRGHTLHQPPHPQGSGYPLPRLDRSRARVCPPTLVFPLAGRPAHKHTS